LYIRDLIASFTRPVKELKAFELVELNPQETKVITFKIDEKMLAFYTANNKWEAEPGEFKIFVGGSSDVTIEESFELIKK
jgi:beta-glucosidase